MSELRHPGGISMEQSTHSALNKSKLWRNMIQTADTRLIVIQHLGLSDPDFIFPWPTLIIRSP